MPMKHVLLLVGALVAATPVLAQPPGPMGTERGRGSVPLLDGARYPTTLGPARRGAIGRPRATGVLWVELDLVSACTIDTGATRPFVRCSDDVPFRAVASPAPPSANGQTAGAPRIIVEY